MLQRIKQLLELIRFSHTVFALPFALLSAILAWRETEFRWQDLLGIVVCMIFARSAAMAFNRVVDRDIDGDNPRTKKRHIPAQLISTKAVTLFTLICSLGFIASTLIFLPKRMPIYLSVPVLVFLLGYSYTKRWTSLCHYWLSTALMLSPIAAWIAITDTVAWTPVLLASVIFFWVGGFDIIYACQDVDFDRKRRLHSIPARFGVAKALKIAMLSHIGTALCLFGLWQIADLGLPFLVGAVLVSILLAYEHWLVRPDDLTRVNIAFFNVNSVISVGLLVVGAVDVYFL